MSYLLNFSKYKVFFYFILSFYLYIFCMHVGDNDNENEFIGKNEQQLLWTKITQIIHSS